MVSRLSKRHRESTGAIIALCVAAAFLSAPCQARDRGLNQPGAIGNHPVGVDPGINQPGALGNRGIGVDPGINQPGAVGNRGVVR